MIDTEIDVRMTITGFTKGRVSDIAKAIDGEAYWSEDFPDIDNDGYRAFDAETTVPECDDEWAAIDIAYNWIQECCGEDADMDNLYFTVISGDD